MRYVFIVCFQDSTGQMLQHYVVAKSMATAVNAAREKSGLPPDKEPISVQQHSKIDFEAE